MAAKNKLEILVTAITDKAVKELGKLDKASESLGKETEKAGGKLGVLDGVMLAAGAMAVNMAMKLAKSIPEMLELGVQADRAETALKGYAGGSREAAEYTDAVRDAAGGAISKMDAMQNASRLLAMGLATNTDEASKLTEMAITLGASMGKGPKQAFEEFTLMLANQSIPRLDTFGISASKVRERMAELADENAGLDRQTRFLIATMEIGEGKLDQLAEAGFDATSSLDQLKAMMTDMKVEAASALSDGIMPLIDGIIELREANFDNAEQALKTADTFEEYIVQLYGLKDGAAKLNPEMMATAQVAWEVELASRDASNAAYELHEEYKLGKVVFEEGEEAVRNYADELDALSEIVDNKVGKAYDRFKKKQGDMNESIDDTKGKIAELEAMEYITPDQLGQIDNANADIEYWEGWVKTLEGQIDELNKYELLTDLQKAQLGQAKLDLETMQGNVENAKGSIEGLNELKLATEDQFGQLDTLNGKLGEQEQAIIDLEEEHDLATNKMIFNMAAQRAAVDGEVDAMELKLLEGLAGSFGLVDDKQVNTTLGIELAFQALAMPGAGLDTALQIILGVAAGIDSIPNYKQIDIVANVSMVGADLARITGGYGFQHGGQFTVGGRSGIDRNLVAFRATRGETVTVTPQGGGGGSRAINIHFHGPVYAEEYELERLILPIVERGIREDKMNG